MMKPNMHYADLKDSYLFYNIAQKTNAYLLAHPGAHLYRMGIGDVSLPLCPAVIQALHEAVDDQANKARFHGYMPECGDPALRERTKQIFLRTAIRGEAPESVAAAFGMKRNAVDQAKNRVLVRLKAKISELEGV